MKKINLIFGTMTIGEQIFDDTALEFLRYCISGGINELDTMSIMTVNVRKSSAEH